MKRGYVKTSPYFFRLIKIAMAVMLLTLLVLAALVPAPLQEQADIARVPNPVKSAWFLLWIQELVSYSKYQIYLVLVLAACFLGLPWLSPGAPVEQASWFARKRQAVSFAALALFEVPIGSSSPPSDSIRLLPAPSGPAGQRRQGLLPQVPPFPLSLSGQLRGLPPWRSTIGSAAHRAP
jgi:hypothetical protein